MKLKLTHYHQTRNPEHLESVTVYHFVDESGVSYKASIDAGRSDYERSRRWYELACGLITANKNGMDLWIMLENDPPPFCYDLNPDTNFKIELTERTFRPTMPADAPRERFRRDTHDGE
jgi:hypothetical protein